MGMETDKRRKTYDRQFKMNAVGLVLDGGRKVREVARELGIDANTLYHWKREFLEEQEAAFPGKGHLPPMEEEIREATAGVGRGTRRPGDFKKSPGILLQAREVRYRFVEEHREQWGVKRLCRLLKLSRGGYYAWKRRIPSARTLENKQLRENIERLYQEGRGTYGSPTICESLRQEGLRVNHKRIARLMRQIRLRSKVARRFRRTTRRCDDRDAAPNLLEQCFWTDGPNRLWLSDITYLWTSEGWLYLTFIEDAWSRLPVGYAMSTHLRAEALIEALRMALGRRSVRPGLIFHSDRGKQYVDGNVRNILHQHGIVQSMSSTGNCYDNAMAESFIATLKKTHVYWQRFTTRDEARRSIFEYLEIFYSRVRRHSALGYKSPMAFEQSQTVAFSSVQNTG
jgi:putative transposase